MLKKYLLASAAVVCVVSLTASAFYCPKKIVCHHLPNCSGIPAGFGVNPGGSLQSGTNHFSGAIAITSQTYNVLGCQYNHHEAAGIMPYAKNRYFAKMDNHSGWKYVTQWHEPCHENSHSKHCTAKKYICASTHPMDCPVYRK